MSTVIPQKDVKPIAYDLINTFGSLENVLKAKPDDLMQVKGVGEITAVALSPVRDMNKRVSSNRNRNIVKLNTICDAMNYCVNALSEEKQETLILVTLANNGAVLNKHIINQGSVRGITAEPRQLIEYIVRNNAAGVIMAHNHPSGDPTPSANDIAFTVEFRATLRRLDINFVDHIIVSGNDCWSMKRDSKEFMPD
ncbi:MAG: DNA repair protein RadC [Clostridiales bacterium]|nr:DNA repair protein RadC [Clostridiales bacterium]